MLSVAGKVVRRDAETINPALPTGEVEVAVAAAELLADSETPPFQIEGYADDVGEDTRLRYRYLDLRRAPMREALLLRHRVTAAMREFLGAEGFVDVETPVLTRSTPEGARDFLVPSRQQQGSFYALPQSPQLFKQLLMVSGFERYFQIARCFRDEATRADRQPEFTQLDVEMSFVEVDDVIAINERLLAHVFAAVGGPEIDRRRCSGCPTPRRWTASAPTGRTCASGSSWSTSARRSPRPSSKSSGRCSRRGGSIRGINAGKREVPRKELDGFISRAQELGAKGLVWAFREGDGWRSPTAKFLSEAELAELNRLLGAEEGDLLLLVADKRPVTDAVLGQMRLDLGERFGLIDENENRLVWIVDFPLFLYDEVEKRWDAVHHPFTAPAGRVRPERPGRGAVPGLRRGLERPGARRRLDPYPRRRGPAAGLRRCSGSTPRRREARFGFLLEALRYGAPPHGGIAYGIDRFVQRLAGAETIRDVIAFPKTASGLRPADRRAGPGRRAAAARGRRRHPQTGQSRALRWRCGTGYPAGWPWARARVRRRSTSTTRASNAGRWCGTSATCAPRAPGTRR